jgi:hypothetical protein
MHCSNKQKKTFIKAVTEGLAAPPQYFPVNAKINKEGYSSLDASDGKSITSIKCKCTLKPLLIKKKLLFLIQDMQKNL